MEIYYEKLANVIMEAEKSYNWASPSWRTRKASGTIQSKSESLRIRADDDVNPGLRPEKMKWDVPAQIMRQEKGQIPPSSAFCSV